MPKSEVPAFTAMPRLKAPDPVQGLMLRINNSVERSDLIIVVVGVAVVVDDSRENVRRQGSDAKP
jgi:hypothetical protein